MIATDQRREALARANHIRAYRKVLKQSLHDAVTAKGSRLAAAQIILHPPDEAHTMRLYTLLRACREIGVKKARYLMRTARVRDTTLAKLTEREVHAIVAQLYRTSLPNPLPKEN